MNYRVDDKVYIYMPDQIEMLKFIYKNDKNILESLKNINKLYNKIEDNKNYSDDVKHLVFKSEDDNDSVYKIDFFELEDVHSPEYSDNDFYSHKLFKDWLVNLESIKKYLNENDIEANDKKNINLTVFEMKKELLKINEELKKKEKDNPLAYIFDIDEDEFNLSLYDIESLI